MSIQTESFMLPETWACAFLYGDESGMEQEEIDAIESMDLGHCCDVISDESGDFRRWHDAAHVYPYAANVAEFVFIKEGKTQ